MSGRSLLELIKNAGQYGIGIIHRPGGVPRA